MTAARVESQTATVYVGGGRRWLTRRSAYRAEARAMVLRKHGCECEPDVGWTCSSHAPGGLLSDVDRYTNLVDRLARFLAYADGFRMRSLGHRSRAAGSTEDEATL